MVYRVATRYASKQLVNDAIQAFRAARPRIEALLQAKNIPAAKERFLELGRELAPLASALDNIKFSRPDEQRKLKNVIGWLRHLQRAFDSRSLELDETIQDIHIHNHLESLADTLKSLSRVADRIEGYAKVEKTFSHGPWQIVNKYGFSVSEYAEPLEVLDKASDRVRAKGFGDLLYGEVLLDTKVSRPGVAGEYFKASDSIALTVDAKNQHSDVFTLVHEIGHRRWHKHLSTAQQEQYEDLYSAGGLTVDQRQDLFQALVKGEFRPAAAKKFLREKGLPVAEYLKEIGASPKDYWRAYSEAGAWVERQVVRPNHRYVRLKSVKVETVSSYAATNVREDFAETFATYVFNMPIPSSVMKRFELTL
jgi:hypothetical protein